eukprot:gnl/TRDRNA2_/TRDRNA2_184341_c0_seq1.p1 gnl/TRDRNA2_/TRDRNA2_184341_c0~~gnl/TRDRNA2_/TRDRNA2_184341_c0_seq1.p1  ORF type:complete len:525 (-),score=94.53 gnl/TRDRNA2_/TRDRNA2_184341_c0_seq1:108-1658(-)
MATSVDLECCVCFGATSSKTPCGHVLCQKCRCLLRKKVCPICRRELPEAQQQQSAAAQGAHRPNALVIPPHTISPAQPTYAAAMTTLRSSSVPRRTSLASSRREFVDPPFDMPRLRRQRSTTLLNNDEPHSPVSPVSPSSPMSRSLTSWRPARRNMGISDILFRISRMTMSEASHFIEHVVWLQRDELVTADDGSKLCCAVRRRVAHLLGDTPLSTLGLAASTLEQLMSHAEDFPAFAGDLTPRRSLESRIAYLAYHPPITDGSSSELDTLQECHEQTMRLLLAGLVTDRSRAHVSARITRWIEQAQLSQIHREAAKLKSLVDAEPGLQTDIVARVAHFVRGLRTSGPADLGRLLSTVLDLEQAGLICFQGVLQEALLKKFRSCIQSWVLTQIADTLEGQSEYLELCRRCDTIHAGLIPLFTGRLTQDVVSIASVLAVSDDVPLLQGQLAEWAQVVQRAGSAGLVAFDAATRQSIVDEFSKCYNACMSSSKLKGAANDVGNMQMNVVMVLGRTCTQ